MPLSEMAALTLPFSILFLSFFLTVTGLLLFSGQFREHLVVGGASPEDSFIFNIFLGNTANVFKKIEIGGIVCGLLICNMNPWPSCL